MNNDYTIGFKYRDGDYTACVSTISTSAFTFYRVKLNDDVLSVAFGPYFNFFQDALKREAIKCMRAVPIELETCIMGELNRII